MTQRQLTAKNIYSFLALTSAALISYFISIRINSVFGASLVGLFFGLLFPKYSMPAYCGAFIGMASIEILPSYLYIISASFVSGLVRLLILKKIPNIGDVGGKAGFIAFLGVFIINLPLIFEKEIYRQTLVEMKLIVPIIVVPILSTVATFYLREIIRGGIKSDAVVGSAILGLLFGLVQIFVPQTSIFSEVAFASSFAGMTSFEFVKKRWSKTVLGLIVGIVFLVSIPYFQGFGGKLGTISFLSSLTFLSLRKNKIFRKIL